MTLRIDFTTGGWKIIEADEWRIDGELIRFENAGETVLTAVLRNLVAIEPEAIPSRNFAPG